MNREQQDTRWWHWDVIFLSISIKYNYILRTYEFIRASNSAFAKFILIYGNNGISRRKMIYLKSSHCVSDLN